ncbi:MAG: hypothetical protein ACO2PO_16970 [Candidatus Calescibacterium sp.]
MPNKRYVSGRQFEYKIKQHLEKEGWKVFRTSGSHGLFDLIGIKISFVGESTVRSHYSLSLGFWQLKKHISHEKAEAILCQIQKELFGSQLQGLLGLGGGKNYFEQSINFVLTSTELTPYTQKIFVIFGVIYTLPKKKKLDKRKRSIIKVGKTLKGGEKVAEATSG